MFKNIGDKIETLAEIICVLGIIASIGVGLFLGGINEDLFTFLLYAGLGSLGSWIGSFFLYGFGRLVTSAEKTASNTDLIIHQNRAIQKNQKSIYNNIKNLQDSDIDCSDETESPEAL